MTYDDLQRRTRRALDSLVDVGRGDHGRMATHIVADAAWRWINCRVPMGAQESIADLTPPPDDEGSGNGVGGIPGAGS